MGAAGTIREDSPTGNENLSASAGGEILDCSDNALTQGVFLRVNSLADAHVARAAARDSRTAE